MTSRFRLLIIGFGFAVAASPAMASSLTYTPTNPTFGGNPLNGTYFLSQAQAQGEGAKSGANSPDLSGLNNALSNLGSSLSNPIVINVGGNNGTGSGSTSSNPTNAAKIPSNP